MQPRRSLALVVGVLLALPLLASCGISGFSKGTNIPYTPAAGTNYHQGDVDVLNALVVAAQPDSGTFIASLANNTDSDVVFTGVGGGAGNTVTAGDIEPVTIGARGFVNLADGQLGVPIRGTFGAGDVIPLTLNFESGDTVTMEVPVTYACQEYTGLDLSTASSSAAASSSASTSGSTSTSPAASGSPAASASPANPSGSTTSAVPSSSSSTGSSSTSSSSTSTGAPTQEPTETAGASASSSAAASASTSAYACGTSGGTGGRN